MPCLLSVGILATSISDFQCANREGRAYQFVLWVVLSWTSSVLSGLWVLAQCPSPSKGPHTTAIVSLETNGWVVQQETRTASPKVRRGPDKKSPDCSISFSAVLLAVLGPVAGMLLRPELSWHLPLQVLVESIWLCGLWRGISDSWLEVQLSESFQALMKKKKKKLWWMDLD